MSMFHERLKELKDKSGKTQAAIAEDLGMTPQSFSYYLNGREPSYDTLIKIANYFNVPIDYLLGVAKAKKAENEPIIEALGLTEKSIASIKLVAAYDSIEPGNDNRPMLEILNLFLEEETLPLFIALMKKLTDPAKVKWGAYQWEGEKQPTAFPILPEISESSAYKTLLQDVLSDNVESLRKKSANNKMPQYFRNDTETSK